MISKDKYKILAPKWDRLPCPSCNNQHVQMAIVSGGYCVQCSCHKHGIGPCENYGTAVKLWNRHVNDFERDTLSECDLSTLIGEKRWR